MEAGGISDTWARPQLCRGAATPTRRIADTFTHRQSQLCNVGLTCIMCNGARWGGGFGGAAGLPQQLCRVGGRMARVHRATASRNVSPSRLFEA